MPNWSHAMAALMVFSLMVGALLAVPVAARADGPIVGKPIIHKDPKPLPKGNAAPADFTRPNAA